MLLLRPEGRCARPISSYLPRGLENYFQQVIRHLPTALRPWITDRDHLPNSASLTYYWHGFPHNQPARRSDRIGSLGSISGPTRVTLSAYLLTVSTEYNQPICIPGVLEFAFRRRLSLGPDLHLLCIGGEPWLVSREKLHHGISGEERPRQTRGYTKLL